jgi:succinoglycan biosynthesis transport protein ExoP
MMIETRKSALQQSLLGDAPPDAAWIESQIGVLKSHNVAAYVVKQLRLADDPELAPSDTGLLAKVLARISPSEPKPEAERIGQAARALASQLDIRRMGQSYILRVDFRSRNPELGTRVANAMIDGYIFEQLNAKYQANRRAGDWLQERLQTLRDQAAAAERAVVEFKAKNNIVTTGGTLMNEKQLSEISGKLAAARAHTSDLQARLERVGAVRLAYQQERSSAIDENVSEAMSNPIISRLREQYLNSVSREADWSVRFGADHAVVMNLRKQIRDIRNSIRDELGRIEQTFKSEFEIAKRRQAELEKGLEGLISQSTETNQAQVALFSLEAAAQSYRRLYDNFLQRHTETVQQQSFPVSDARLISPASVAKTGPQPFKLWIMTVFMGGMLGVGLGILREVMDRGFRTKEQVRSVLEKECIGLVPLLEDEGLRKSSLELRLLPALTKIIEFRTSLDHDVGPKRIVSAPRIMRAILDAPMSPYAEAIRSIKLTIDMGRAEKQTKVVGLTSCFPSEGKSTLALAMATLIAQSGARVILVDCDLRNPSLSRTLKPDANVGLLDVIAGKVALADAVWTHGNMAFLPPGADRLSPNVTTLLGSDAARSVFDTLRFKYGYVIVDLAPLIADLDVRATSRLIDSYILVIEWGSTKIEAVQYALRNAPAVQENVVGAVLNKVDMASLSRYDNYGANNYYGQSRYGTQ